MACSENKTFSDVTKTCLTNFELKLLADVRKNYEYKDKFICPESGAFSDPYDCKYYYTCDSNVKFAIGKKHKCPDESYFNDELNHCSTKLTSKCVKLLENLSDKDEMQASYLRQVLKKRKDYTRYLNKNRKPYKKVKKPRDKSSYDVKKKQQKPIKKKKKTRLLLLLSLLPPPPPLLPLSDTT